MSKVRITNRGGRKGRGFHQYGPPYRDAHGNLIDVYESSSAEGPHVWVAINGTYDRHGRIAGAISHLNVEQVRRLMDKLQAFLDEVPVRWGKR